MRLMLALEHPVSFQCCDEAAFCLFIFWKRDDISSQGCGIGSDKVLGFRDLVNANIFYNLTKLK
jgi:hypothetical protein